MTKKAKRRQITRLWDMIQTEESYSCKDGGYDYVITKPATRPMHGKSVQRLIGIHAKDIEQLFNGSFVRYGEKSELPRFNPNCKYILVVSYKNSDYPTIWANPVS